MSMQSEIILCTNEYPPDHGGVARYLEGYVTHSAEPIRVIIVSRTARWFEVFRTVWSESRLGTHFWCSHIFPIGTALWALSWVRGVRYELFFHGRDIALATHAGMIRRWLARRIIARAQYVYANSAHTASLVSALCPTRKIEVRYPRIQHIQKITPEQIALVRKTAEIPVDALILLVVARLVARKGVDRVVRAVASRTTKTPVVLVIVGDGPERAKLEALAATLGIAPQLRWVGAADDTQLQHWYGAADIFVLPARATATDFEGFGMVYSEAACAGLPVIATRTGGIPEAVIDGETGILIPDTDDFAPLLMAIEQLLTDASLRAHMGERGRTYVHEHFLWND